MMTTSLSKLQPEDFKYDEPLHKLGEGGLAQVYRGTWNGKAVAIKKLRNQSLDGDDLTEFEKEAANMQACQSERVVKLFGICLANDQHALILELMEGGALYQLLKKGDEKEPLSWETRWRIASEAAEGLAYLHSKGIIHRDVKSPNVLLDGNWHAKISDFGEAKIKLLTSATTTAQRKSSTGTTRWRAPEAFPSRVNPRPKAGSKQADVYSFGVLMWEIASRKIPYNGTEEDLVRYSIQDGHVEERPKECPDPYWNIITKHCWKFKPEERSSMSQILASIKQIMPKSGSGSEKDFSSTEEVSSPQISSGRSSTKESASETGSLKEAEKKLDYELNRLGAHSVYHLSFENSDVNIHGNTVALANLSTVDLSLPPLLWLALVEGVGKLEFDGSRSYRKIDYPPHGLQMTGTAAWGFIVRFAEPVILVDCNFVLNGMKICIGTAEWKGVNQLHTFYGNDKPNDYPWWAAEAKRYAEQPISEFFNDKISRADLEFQFSATVDLTLSDEQEELLRNALKKHYQYVNRKVDSGQGRQHLPSFSTKDFDNMYTFDVDKEAIEKLAESGDMQGQFQFALILSSENQQEAAYKYYQMAANQGHEEAKKVIVERGVDPHFTEGNRYLYGLDGGEKQVGKAIEHFQRGADEGFPLSLYTLGYMYWNGSEVEKNQEVALEYLREAANKNYPPAIFMLAKINGEK